MVMTTRLMMNEKRERSDCTGGNITNVTDAYVLAQLCESHDHYMHMQKRARDQRANVTHSPDAYVLTRAWEDLN